MLLCVFIPVSGAFKPVEDIGAAGVVHLVKRMGIRLLHSHCIARMIEYNSSTRRSETLDKKTVVMWKSDSVGYQWLSMSFV